MSQGSWYPPYSRILRRGGQQVPFGFNTRVNMNDWNLLKVSHPWLKGKITSSNQTNHHFPRGFPPSLEDDFFRIFV